MRQKHDSILSIDNLAYKKTRLGFLFSTSAKTTDFRKKFVSLQNNAKQCYDIINLDCTHCFACPPNERVQLIVGTSQKHKQCHPERLTFVQILWSTSEVAQANRSDQTRQRRCDLSIQPVLYQTQVRVVGCQKSVKG